jgi:hypothetical protein
MRVSIEGALKAKWPRTALGCVTAHVEAPAAAAALVEDMQARV